MANRHFAEIGDIWKHLPLAEILAVERPRRYWESHAGAARYPLTPSLGRDYGAFYFLRQGARSAALRASAFWGVLQDLEPADGETPTYPGSPLVALTVLGRDPDHYLFCDLDGASLRTIRVQARRRGLPGERVACVQGDGVGTLWRAVARLSARQAAETLAHVDPYRVAESTASGRTSLDLFGELSRRGVKTVLWYGYGSASARDACWDQLRSTVAAFGLDGATWWCGEINLAALHDPGFDLDPGVLGCGILTGNLSERAVSACAELGRALAESYRGATFPTGQSGALDFEIVRVR